MPVEALIPHEMNANTHPEKQIKTLAKLMNYQGWRHPIIVSKLSGKIVAGHGRLSAAKLNGWSECPVDMQDFDDKAQELAFLASDNIIQELAETDDDKLIALIKDSGLDDLELFGNDDFQLPPDYAAEREAMEDEVPEVTESISKLGDLYELGEHRLLCGDSTDKDTVERLMNGQSPRLMVTDPPYGVSYDAEWRKEALGDKFIGKVRTGKVSNDDNADWTEVWGLSNAQIFYVWHASAFDHIVKKSLVDAGYEVRQQIIWNKTVAAMSRSAYHWKHEPCLYGVKIGCDANWVGDRKQNTVWDIASPIHIMSGSKEDKTGHPTQKPIEVYTRPISCHTIKGDILYDPFAGSGSALVACEKTGRRAYLMELDPKYCDIIIARYVKYSGNKNIKRNGEPMEWTIGQT